MNIYLLRHAQTATNAERRLSSLFDERLDACGLSQAKRLVKPLSTMQFDAIWCSPMPRAIETIAPFVRCSKQEVELVPDLSEGQLHLEPALDPVTPQYTQVTLPADIQGLIPSIPETINIPMHDESVQQCRTRVNNILERLSSLGNTSILLVSHGHMIREMLNALMECKNYTRFPVSNGSITHFEISKHRFLHSYNQTII